MEKLISSRSAAVGRPVWLLAALRWRYSFSRSAEEVAAEFCGGALTMEKLIVLSKCTETHRLTRILVEKEKEKVDQIR